MLPSCRMTVTTWALCLLLTVGITAQAPGPSHVIDLLQLGYSDAEIKKELEAAPSFPRFSVEQLEELRDAGASKELLAWIRHKGQPADTEQAPPKRLPPHHEILMDGVFEHRGRRFTIRCPKGWAQYRDINEGQVRFVFSPETGKSRIEALDVAMSVSLSTLEPSSVLGEQDARSVLKRLVPMLRLVEPGFEPIGEVRDCKLGELKAAALRFRGHPKNRKETFDVEMRIAVQEPLAFVVTTGAIDGSWQKHAATFERVLAQSSFGSPFRTRHQQRLEAHQISERHRESVVYVEGQSGFVRGQGTGFVVRSDGYILTNWHVVWSSRNGKPHKKLRVRWEDDLRKKSVPARLVGFARRHTAEYHLGGALGGDDVALLHIEGDGYVPFPLTEAPSVRLGDPIVTMGFPRSFNLATLSTFLTQGVVTRFNRNLQGQLQSFATDAKTTHGSSGGPCIDLVTGGVIGLNTWGYDIGMKTEEGDSLNDFVGYSFVCPIDAALRAFPLVVDFGLEEDPQLEYFEAYDLAQLCLGKRAFKAAVKLAEQTVRLQNTQADALWLRAMTQEAYAWDLLSRKETEQAQQLAQRARSSYEQARHVDPGNTATLISGTRFFLSMSELDRAKEWAEAAVEHCAEDWAAHAVAAEVALARNEFELADQHAKATQRLARDIVPDGHLLLARAAYARNWNEIGHNAALEALKIHPRNLEGTMLEAEYLERIGNWKDAVSAWQRFSDDFAGHPLGHFHRARSLAQLGDRQAALLAFDKAEDGYAKHGIVPPHDFYLEYAQLARAEDFATRALMCYGKQLEHHGRAADAWRVHLQAAKLFRDQKAPDLASLHARAAERLRRATDKDFEVEEHPLRRPPLEGIVWLVKGVEFPAGLICDLISKHPLRYAIPLDPEATRKAEFRKLFEKGLSAPIILAIIESNKRFPVQEQARVAKQPQQRVPDHPGPNPKDRQTVADSSAARPLAPGC
jgi:S1-C subfamily serine protease/tetratricopeptide (TPR) repeat protein